MASGAMPGARTPGKVYVTGASGFLGAAVVRHLGPAAVPVTRATHGDLRDLPAEAFAGVDAVLHLAARTPMNDPGADFRTANTKALERVLRVAAVGGCHAFVLASSASVYGTSVSGPLPESSPHRPVGPYGEACAACENLVSEATAIPARSIVRIFNPYGTQGRGILNKLVSFAAGQAPPPRVQGLDTVRDFVHEDDVARILAGVRGHPGAFNAGTGIGTTTREAVRLVEQVFGVQVPTQAPPSGAVPLDSSVADVGRLERLGLLPRIRLADWVAEQGRARARPA